MTLQKVVLITGCSSGFGRLIAETVARKGHRTFASMVDIRGASAPACAELETLAETENLALEVVEINVTDEVGIEQAVADIHRKAGRIDVLVNNAGVAIIGLNETLTIEQAKWIFDTNFFGYARMDRAVLPSMRRQRLGLLIHVASVLSRTPLPFMGIYCASKAAIEVLAETYRYELASLGIDSVIIDPGAFPSGMVKLDSIQPGDPTRLAEYGSLADRVQQMFGGIVNMVSGSNAPNPQAVADAVLRLIETPPGQRPLRTLVGDDAQSAAPLIDLAEQAQKQLMEALGLSDMIAVASQS